MICNRCKVPLSIMLNHQSQMVIVSFQTQRYFVKYCEDIIQQHLWIFFTTYGQGIIGYIMRLSGLLVEIQIRYVGIQQPV